MRSVAVSLCALALAAGPALAEPGSPTQGAAVSVETIPGGRVTTYNSPTEAQTACVGAGGGFGIRGRTLICVNPRTRLQSTRAPDPAPAPPPR